MISRNDLDREKEKADEELRSLLKGMVIVPMDELVQIRLKEELFELANKIDKNLASSFSRVAKTNELNDKFTELGDDVDELSQYLRKSIIQLAENARSNFEKFEPILAENNSGLAALQEQVEVNHQWLRKEAEHSAALLSNKLNEQSRELVDRVDRSNNDLLEDNKRLLSVLARLERITADESKQASIFVKKLEHDLSFLTQRYNDVDNKLQQVLGYLEALHENAADHQQEARRAYESIIRTSWFGMTVMVGFVIFIAVQTPWFSAYFGG